MITEITTYSDACLDAINRLLPQLSSSGRQMTNDQLQSMIANNDTHLFVAEANGTVLGMLSLCTYATPTGRKWWVEDVVVDQQARGQHIGRSLVEHAIHYARTHGGGTIMLTSRPQRVAANQLYQSLGMQQKPTNVYQTQ